MTPGSARRVAPSRSKTGEPSGIFISYRREDSLSQVVHLGERLRDRFGDYVVFVDKTDIAPGTDFPDRIRQAISWSAVVLVVIGPGWLNANDQNGKRRLDDPADWVRIEVALALSTPAVLVIPVLVGGASLPRKEELPPDLQKLPDLNAVNLRDSDWYADFETLSVNIAVAVRRRDAGLVGALSLALLAALVAALTMVSVRAVAPLFAPAGASAALVIVAATLAAAGAGWAGLAGSRPWLARLSRAVRRPASWMAALALLSLLGITYHAARPVKVIVESVQAADPCDYSFKVQPYLESGDRNWQGGPRLLDAGIAPCKTEFVERYQRISIRTGWWPRRASAAVRVRVTPGSIRAVLTGTTLPENGSRGDVPVAPDPMELPIADLADAARFVCWFTVQSAEDRVFVTVTLTAGGGVLGTDSTWVPVS